MTNRPPGYPPPQSMQGPPPGGYGAAQGYRGEPQYGQPPPAPGLVLHPYAALALVLGIFALVTTAVTGIPAILLGYSAIKGIEAQPHIFEGKTKAKAGILLGCVGSCVFGLLLGRGLGHSSVTSGVTTVLLGLAVFAGVLTVAKKWAWRSSRCLAFAATPTLVVIGATSGLIGGHAAAAAKFALCQRNESATKSQVVAKNLNGAQTSLDLARDECPDTEQATIAELSHMLEQQETAAKQIADEQTAMQLAAAAAAKDDQAVASFPQASTQINALYKRASSEMSAGQWSAADGDLSTAESDLGNYDGTSVGSTKSWTDLSVKLVALRQRLQPQLDRIAARERKKSEAQAATDEAERRASAAVDAVRGQAPTNSAWDGSIHCVERYLKEAMNDPDSYQHMSTTEPVAVGAYWVVISRFRAKNGFGALTVHQATFKIQQDQVVGMGED